MSKAEELQKLKTEMAADASLPLKKGATQLVFGEGDPETKILFIGEGPGYHEDQKGIPFIGNAGILLNKLLALINLKREDVFITNVVHHRPPENRDPLPEELMAYGKYLDKIIEIINPKIIVTLGRFSMGKFLPAERITSVHGKVFRVKWHDKDLTVVPMYHPAAALRRGDVMDAIKADFLKLPEILKDLGKEESKVEVKQMELI